MACLFLFPVANAIFATSMDPTASRITSIIEQEIEGIRNIPVNASIQQAI